MTFQALLRQTNGQPISPALLPGSRVGIAGICSIERAKDLVCQAASARPDRRCNHGNPAWHCSFGIANPGRIQFAFTELRPMSAPL
jgi:hypothetical protein